MKGLGPWRPIALLEAAGKLMEICRLAETNDLLLQMRVRQGHWQSTETLISSPLTRIQTVWGEAEKNDHSAVRKHLGGRCTAHFEAP